MELHTKTSDYFYDLPEELIAQTPIEPRDSSRLLVLGRKDGSIRHAVFRDIIDFLEPDNIHHSAHVVFLLLYEF